MMVSVSIIVPVYNAAQYISKWFDCMRRQTFQDYEVLFIEDYSKDSSWNECLKITKEDNRIQLHRNPGKGAGAARNYGIKIARGQYIGFLDIDDTFEADMFERMYSIAKDTGVKVVKCGFNTIESSTNEITSEVLPIEGVYSSSQFIDNLVLGQGDGAVWNLLIDAKVAKKLSFPEGQIMEDIAFCAQLATIVDSVYGIARPLYHYWQNSSSVMHRDLTKRLYDTGLSHMQISQYAYEMQCYSACGAAYTVVLQAFLNISSDLTQKSVSQEQLMLLWNWLKEKRCWRSYEKRFSVAKKIYYTIPFVNLKIFLAIKKLLDK